MRFKGFISDIINFFNNVNSTALPDLGANIKAAMEEPINFILQPGNVGRTELQILYDYLVPVAIMMCVAYVLIDMLNKATMINFSIDILIKNMVRLIIGVAIINNGLDIIWGLNNVSMWIVELMTVNANITIDVSPIAEISLIDNIFGLFIALFEIFKQIITGEVFVNLLNMFLIHFYITIIACQRAVKIGYYSIMAPLVFADMTGHGLNTKTKKYCMRLLGIFMEYPIIMVGTQAAISLIASSSRGPYIAAYVGLLSPLLILSVMSKGKRIANQIIG